MKTLIVSEDTVRELVEAHASMAAWYYQLAGALRNAGGQVEAPDDATRAAFVAQIAGQYPEIAQVARTLTRPRPYVPPPVFPSAAAVPAVAANPAAAPEPAIEPEPPPPAQAAPPEPPRSDAPGALAPPPMIVDPSKVKY